MKITAIGLSDDLHASVRAAYPEHEWTFIASDARLRLMGRKFIRSLGRGADLYVLSCDDVALDALAATLHKANVHVLYSQMLKPEGVKGAGLCRFALLPYGALMPQEGSSGAAWLARHMRYLDGETHARVPHDQVRQRLAACAPSGVAQEGEGVIDAPQRPRSIAGGDLCLMAGTSVGIAGSPASLFETADIIQAPATDTANGLIDSPEVLAGQDLIVWQGLQHPDWVHGVTGRVRVLSRYPAGMPMHLNQDGGFFPVLSCDKLREEKAAGGVSTLHYDLATDLDALSNAGRDHLRGLGRIMLPDLAGLQSTWRMQRHNLFVMTRKLGLKEGFRLVVLGRAAPHEGLRVHTNPEGMDDLDLVMRVLTAHPKAEIIYQPHPSMNMDKTLCEKMAALSDRVRIIGPEYNASELALVCDAFHTVDSPLGLPALLTEKPVIVYGMPSYAGLGLTRDLDAQGGTRPLLVASAVDLPLFVGWYFPQNVLFVDPITGLRAAAINYAATWYPVRGAMRDEQATRMGACAQASPSPEFRMAILHMLQMHGQDVPVRALLKHIDLDAEIAVRPHVALAYAEAYASLGDWQFSLEIAAKILGHHRIKRTGRAKSAEKAEVANKVAETIAFIRSRLRKTDDCAVFETRLLTLLHKTSAADMEKIARKLMRKRYYSAALAVLNAQPPSIGVLKAVCRCHIGRCDAQAGRQTITDLAALGMPQEQSADLVLALHEATGEWTKVVEALTRRLQQDPADPELMLRYAQACVHAGQYDEAHDIFSRLVDTPQQTEAVRGLAALEIARMNIPAARALLEPVLATRTADQALYRLMGDCLNFENNFEEACVYYFRAMQLNGLDTPSYRSLRELEAELDKSGCAPEVLWSTRLKARFEQAGDPTVETLLGAGRAGLLDNDTETMRINAARAITLFPNDLRAYAWWSHAMTWTAGRRTPQEVSQIIARYRATIAGGGEDGWWSTYDFTRSMAFLGQSAELRTLLKEQHRILYVAQKARMGWPRFLAGAALPDLDVAFEALRDYPRTALLRKHARNFRVADSIDEVKAGEKVMVLSEGGVGDEIRYAIAYPELARRFPDAAFSVDKRLARLFRRSFPQVAEFIPLPRFHRTRVNCDLLPMISDLPDQSLAQYADNTVWAAAQKADVVIPAPSVMCDLRPDAPAFANAPRPVLVPDPALLTTWRKRLQPYADTLLVGVIGTSRILEYHRMANYFTPDQMGEMYRLPGVTFVSLEYKDDPEMAAYIRTTFGAQYLSFDDLDKMDDFDGVVALACALDCVVGANTATIELTAFAGVDTIFAAPNAAHIWRDPKGTGEDLFFDKMQLVMGRDPSEKHLVTARIAALLAQRRDAKCSAKTTGA
ncbi:tetratricopeptide repeat protein [uncultured Sulfitobacter sp.]|uniref:tetratricopeptide repeat protein n=1 Tax=uncultured Sulfitobacter sp. TaxID=191468 RepID=UPI00262BDF16|nr:tetratricopeptide repeat protein [uncultured Sulfitobacter sp.]